ncbi:MAG: hypothetical protein HC915_06500 [Anaerolineae bacterium]|nr:hypothetical protein [Anaerolineae bacterium]
MQRYLDGLNWAQPWDAGAHTATVAVFLHTEAPRFLEVDRVRALQAVVNTFVAGLLDRESGAYFRGGRPQYDQRVNGAMKILTALDWLDTAIHRPERLVDACLSQLPDPQGCHLVDVVYVLYRCQQQVSYRQDAVRDYAAQVLGMVQQHFNPADGGFSYHIGRSQTQYHAVPVARGLPISDLHGTILLTWASVMLSELLDLPQPGWQVIKP